MRLHANHPFFANAALPLRESSIAIACFTSPLDLLWLAGSSGLAHVRYPTAGGASAKEAQPFFVNSPLGMFLIHNGNLTNAPALREDLQSSTSFFNRMLRTPSDSEVLLNVFADEIHRAHQRCITEHPQMDPNERKMQFVQEAGQELMQVCSCSRCTAPLSPIRTLCIDSTRDHALPTHQRALC